MDTKTCTKCGETKPIAGFSKDKYTPDGLQRWCRGCFSVWHAAKDPARRVASSRAAHLRRKFGMSDGDYALMLAEQHGMCAVCNSTTSRAKGKPFAVDHCHTTGEVRALLCYPCNTSLGLMRDDPERLRRAALYLEAHRWGNP
jgi:hypothetical protein